MLTWGALPWFCLFSCKGVNDCVHNFLQQLVEHMMLLDFVKFIPNKPLPFLLSENIVVKVLVDTVDVALVNFWKKGV